MSTERVEGLMDALYQSVEQAKAERQGSEKEPLRFCPDGVPPCADCRNGDDLMPDEMCDSCGRSAPTSDLSDCPYFRRYAGLPGADPEGICSYGCRDEPSCVTDRPRHGWPSEPVK